jgi:hypothetical protein
MSVGWAAVSARLRDARIYWLAVVDRRGAPRTFPHWGVVVNEALYFYVDGATGTALDLRRDPRIAVNLQDGENAVLLRGVAQPAGGPAELPQIVVAFAEKYDDPDDARFPSARPEPGDCIYQVTPTWALINEEPGERRVRRFERDPKARIWKPEKGPDARGS